MESSFNRFFTAVNITIVKQQIGVSRTIFDADSIVYHIIPVDLVLVRLTCDGIDCFVEVNNTRIDQLR